VCAWSVNIHPALNVAVKVRSQGCRILGGRTCLF
jgi:hypothetical protein